MYWMITNRNVDADNKTFGDDFTDLSFWQNASDQVDDFDSWISIKEDDFRQGVVAIADTFPDPNNTPSEDQNTSTYSSTDSIILGNLRYSGTGPS
ncbi:MAG TPA: hypothetical protein VN950_11690 [Terriglobales bacterium]|nr:hypothetical protein [Terriglobales bacterium]